METKAGGEDARGIFANMTHEDRKRMINRALNHPRSASIMREILDQAMAMAEKHVKAEGRKYGRAGVMAEAYLFLRYEMNIPRQELEEKLAFTPFEKEMFAFADKMSGK